MGNRGRSFAVTDFRDPALLSAREQARRIRAGELTAAELFGACLARVERHNPELNAVVTLNPAAEAEAAAVDAALAAGGDPGPLAGLVVGVKDVTETAGLRTTYGSPLFADHVPERDAVVVRRLREAGAVILGKTNTPEFAAGGNTWNEVFGVTRNPWNPALSAGRIHREESGRGARHGNGLARAWDGSRRLAADSCFVLRNRRACAPRRGSSRRCRPPTCGTTSRRRALWDGNPEDVAHSGCARSRARIRPRRCARRNPAGTTPRSISPAAGGRTPGTWRASGSTLPVGAACREALASLRAGGAHVDEVDLDLSYAWDAFLVLRGHWFVSHFEAELHRVDAFGPNVSANLRSGLSLTPAEIGAAENVRRHVREELLTLLQRYDALLTPCMAIPPFPVEQNYPESVGGRPMKTYVDWIAPTFLLSMPGLPVACVPAGWMRRGGRSGCRSSGPRAVRGRRSRSPPPSPGRGPSASRPWSRKRESGWQDVPAGTRRA